MSPPKFLGWAFLFWVSRELVMGPGKAALRRELIQRREAIPEATRRTLSASIVSHAARLAADLGATRVGLYLPIKSEVDLTGLRALLDGVTFALPVVAPTGCVMRFHEWRGEARLVANRFGILEPSGERVVAFEANDLLLVPCLAVDRFGVRLGYGGGFYDAFLGTALVNAAGVVFDDFLVPTLPHEAHDVRLARVVTESGVRELKLSGDPQTLA